MDTNNINILIMIPKVIHYCWFGNNNHPKLMRQCLESWRKYNPDFIIKEWNETNSPIKDYPFADQAYKLKKWAFVSDVIRLHALYTEGGIYLDTDVEMLKSFTPLRDAKCFTGYERDSCMLQTAVFGAEIGNPIIKQWLNFYSGRSFSDDRNVMASLVNNRIQSKQLIDKGVVLDGNYYEDEYIKIYPSDFFCPMSYEDHSIKVTNNTYCIHYYSFSWSEPETLKGHIKKYIVSIIGEKLFRKIINALRGKL